jgi:hypothetical protein
VLEFFLKARDMRSSSIDDVTMSSYFVRFEIFTAVTMKNVVFRDVAPCRFCVNRHVTPKRQFTQNPHGVTSQKTAFFNLYTVVVRGNISD